MSIKVTSRIYNEIYTDGETDWLLGNVGEWQTLKIRVEAGIDYLASQQTPIEIDYINNAFILSTGETWGDFGFDPGMVCVFKYKLSQDTNGDGDFDTVSEVLRAYNITNVSGSSLSVLETIEANNFDSLPINYGTKKISDVLLYVSKIPEGCKISYSHLLNDEFDSTSLNSFIDNTETEFAFSKLSILGIGGADGVMEPIGKQSGMSIRSVKVRKKSNASGVATYKNTYEFELQFMISSLFENLTDLQNLEIPSILSGSGSLTDNFKIKFYPEWNNPNVKIENNLSDTKRLGNTGWFNENFNELPNDFNVESIKYFDENGNPVDAIDYATPTKVQVVISGVPNLNSQTECGFGFAWIPTDEADFYSKETPFYRNLFVQSGSIENGFSLNQLYNQTYIGAGIDGGSIDASRVKFTSVNGKIVLEVTMTPNDAFFNTFDNKDTEDRNYIFWVSVADGSLTRSFSDRVALLADVNSLLKTIPPAGSYDQIENSFIEHPSGENAVGETSLQSIVQDDILSRMTLRIPKDGSKVFQQIAFGVEAYNAGTNESQELERYEIDLTQFPITSDGIQQLSIDTTRGFKLKPGNNKNFVKIFRDQDLDTVDFAGYMMFFGTKLRWEDWISKPNASSDFFNALLENNGLNNDWMSYEAVSGWELKFYSKIISSESGDLFEYVNRWDIDLQDYDTNQNVSVSHLYKRDSDGAVLNVGTDPETGRPLGVILSNEPTRIEIEFEILDSGVWDLDNTYAVTTIEIDKGAGEFEQRQISSVWESENDNPLKPLEGETKLKIEIDGTSKFLKSSCIVDPDLLADATRYRISGRVGCKDDDGEIFDSRLYEFRYEDLYQ